jgi:hypothetical protein
MALKQPSTYNKNVSNNRRAAEIWPNLNSTSRPKELRQELQDRTGWRGYTRGLLDGLLRNDDQQKQKFK